MHFSSLSLEIQSSSLSFLLRHAWRQFILCTVAARVSTKLTYLLYLLTYLPLSSSYLPSLLHSVIPSSWLTSFTNPSHHGLYHPPDCFHRFSDCLTVFITAPHGMQTRYSDEKAVNRVHCDKTEERSVQIFIPLERSFSLVFWKEEWLVGATPSTWNFGSTGPHWSEIADYEPIFARSASAVTPSEKSSINVLPSIKILEGASQAAYHESQVKPTGVSCDRPS